jgi:hypothetical protein
MAKTEPDPEIQDLLQRSAGVNLALDYLPGSITFDPLVERHLPGSSRLASSIVWFDALVTNVDRTARNTNLLVWHRAVWMIDHGASLYFHHNWDDADGRSRGAFPQIKDHVLLAHAGELREVHAELAPRLTPDVIAAVVDLIPDAWLEEHEQRAGYRGWFQRRLQSPQAWVEEAIRARSLLV